MSVTDKLREYSEMFRDIKIPALSNNVIDGDYKVRVDKVSLKETINGDPLLKWELIVLEPNDFDGCMITTNNFLNSEMGLKFLKRNLHFCGVNLDSLEELPSNLEKLLDVVLMITRRTNGKFVNIYFNQRCEYDTKLIFNKKDSDIPF